MNWFFFEAVPELEVPVVVGELVQVGRDDPLKGVPHHNELNMRFLLFRPRKRVRPTSWSLVPSWAQEKGSTSKHSWSRSRVHRSPSILERGSPCILGPGDGFTLHPSQGEGSALHPRPRRRVRPPSWAQERYLHSILGPGEGSALQTLNYSSTECPGATLFYVKWR